MFGTTFTMDDILQAKQHLEGARTAEIADLLRSLGAEEDFVETATRGITLDHVVLVPYHLYQETLDLRRRGFVKPLPYGMEHQILVINPRKVMIGGCGQ